MNTTKKITVLVIISFIVQLVPINEFKTYAKGINDKIPPKIYDYSFSKKDVKVGEAIKVYLDIRDNESGVSNVEAKIDGEYRNASYNSYNGKYEVDVHITESMKYKTLQIKGVRTSDKKGNQITYNQDIFREKVVIVKDKNGLVESEKSQLISASVSNNTPQIGEKVHIRVEAKNDKNDINNVFFYLGEIYIDGFDNVVDLIYNTNTGMYEGEFVIEEYMKYDTLPVPMITIVDSSLNETIINQRELLEHLTLKIYGEDGKIDTQQPTINKYWIDNNTVSVGDKVNIFVDSNDDVSGVLSVEYVYYIDNIQRRVELQYNKDIMLYEGSIKITPDMESVKLKSYAIYSTDNLLNITYDHELKDMDILVKSNENILDTQGPVGDRVWIDKVNNMIKVSCNDKISGVSYGEIVYMSSNGNKITTRLSKSNHNELSVNISNVDDFKLYPHEILEVKLLNIYDKMGNKTSYTSNDIDFSQAKIINRGYMDDISEKINLGTIKSGDKSIVGKAKFNNVVIKLHFLYRIRGHLVNVYDYIEMETVKVESDGTFKFNTEYLWDADGLMIEVFDSSTGAAIGYMKSYIRKNTDLNFDGGIDINDLAMVSMFYNEDKRNISNSEDFKSYADFNRDFLIDIYDLVYISKEI